MVDLIDWGVRCSTCKTDVISRRKQIRIGVAELTGLLKDRLPEGIELLRVVPEEFGDGLKFLVSHPDWDIAREGEVSPTGIAVFHRYEDGSITIEEIN
jgi:hypothetical protein